MGVFAVLDHVNELSKGKYCTQTDQKISGFPTNNFTPRVDKMSSHKNITFIIRAIFLLDFLFPYLKQNKVLWNHLLGDYIAYFDIKHVITCDMHV